MCSLSFVVLNSKMASFDAYEQEFQKVYSLILRKIASLPNFAGGNELFSLVELLILILYRKEESSY